MNGLADKWTARTPRTDDGGEGFRFWPAKFEPTLERAQIEPEKALPLPDGQRAAIISEAASPAFVVGLDDRECPSAVGFFVVPVHVHAINGMSTRWTMPHVCKEICEGIAPVIADANSSATVVGVVLIGGGHAASNHVTPRSIFRRFRHAVRGKDFLHALSEDTATTSRVATTEIADSHNAAASALAYAIPASERALILGARLGGKTSEFESGEVEG